MRLAFRTRSRLVPTVLAACVATALAAGASATEKTKRKAGATAMSATDTHAGHSHAGMPEMSPEMMAMMEACQAAATPGAAHAALEPLAGNWNAATKLWMSPDGQPTMGTATSRTEWILGGRYLQQTYQGDMMGMPFQGFGITGYDNVQGRYVGTWMDSMSTGIMTSVGDADATGKRMTFWGEYWDPMTKRPAMMRHTVVVESPNRHVMTMYMTNPETQEQFKSMEIAFTRSQERSGQ